MSRARIFSVRRFAAGLITPFLLVLLFAMAASAEPGLSAAPAEGDPGRRVALVVGNGAYANAPPLPNPPRDASAMAEALRGLGFEVIEAHDVDYRAMQV